MSTGVGVTIKQPSPRYGQAILEVKAKWEDILVRQDPLLYVSSCQKDGSFKSKTEASLKTWTDLGRRASLEVSLWVCHICTKSEAGWEGSPQLSEMTWVRKMEWEMCRN